ncbi:MAG: hypothetical protein NZ703_00525 [Gemmataceae bacterium]|nr:hypothetical protein [Gemmataceae bacterium]
MGRVRMWGSLGWLLVSLAPLWGQPGDRPGTGGGRGAPVAVPEHGEATSAITTVQVAGLGASWPASAAAAPSPPARIPNLWDDLLSDLWPVGNWSNAGASLGQVSTTPLPPAVDSPPALPPGSYPSPLYADSLGCCGPTGRHGSVGYELYYYTGPNLVYGSGDFTNRLNTGWVVGGGGRTLLFNSTYDAAWVLDLGLSYTYNRGDLSNPIFLDIRQPARGDPFSGRAIPQPDLYTLSAIKALHRTNFNFALGRDWWLWGPGANGAQEGWNLRIGGQVGGRWGTAHVDVIPLNQVNGYARRQKVTHGLYLAGYGTMDIPFGGYVLFTGLRVEWGYDWTNIVPPLNGDLQNVNIMLFGGIRF